MKKNMRCLVVDDEQDLLEVMKMILNRFTSDVIVASSVEEGLEILESHCFDLIFSDICMPKFSGFDFLKTIRNKGIETPFVFVSGFTDENRSNMAIELGAIAYINKPFRPQEIYDILAKVAPQKTEEDLTI